MRRIVLAVTCGLSMPMAAESQICRGGSAYAGEIVRVGPRADDLDQATRFGGSVSYGRNRSFGQAELATVSFNTRRYSDELEKTTGVRVLVRLTR